jgi:fatty-acyl-CoA synthase
MSPANAMNLDSPLATLAHWALTTPQQIAIQFADQPITFAQLHARSLGLATTLKTIGIGRGDRLAYLGLNSPQALCALFACEQLGAIYCPLNTRLALAELQTLLDHAGVKHLISDKSHAALAEQLRLPNDAAPHSNPHDDLLLVYTSGTTGEPRGAVHTRAAMMANVRAAMAVQDLLPTDRCLSVLPLFHVGGLCIQTLPTLLAGGTVLLQPRFEANAWLQAVAHEQPSLSLLVPACLRSVLDSPNFATTSLSSLRLLNTGSSIIPTELITAFHTRGVPITQVYGSTESGPVSIALRAEDAFTQVGSAGRAAPGVVVLLRNKLGELCAVDEVGEIMLTAPNVARCYWREEAHPDLQAQRLKTGDLARCDGAGYYTIVGRSKDLIISGGENIYPAEVEACLLRVSGVLECAVLGMPDAQWGERVVAVLVCSQPLTELDLTAALQGQIAKFKWPKQFVFVTELPKTALGKVQKKLLLERLQS